MVFHSPQEGHFPLQRGASNPHSEHTKMVLLLGGMGVVPFFVTTAFIVSYFSFFDKRSYAPTCKYRSTPPPIANAICR
jgi:hypothetical protein